MKFLILLFLFTLDSFSAATPQYILKACQDTVKQWKGTLKSCEVLDRKTVSGETIVLMLSGNSDRSFLFCDLKSCEMNKPLDWQSEVSKKLGKLSLFEKKLIKPDHVGMSGEERFIQFSGYLKGELRGDLEGRNVKKSLEFDIIREAEAPGFFKKLLKTASDQSLIPQSTGEFTFSGEKGIYYPCPYEYRALTQDNKKVIFRFRNADKAYLLVESDMKRLYEWNGTRFNLIQGPGEGQIFPVE